jgi:hypothetical protein
MNVLSEDGELLGQVAVQLDNSQSAACRWRSFRCWNGGCAADHGDVEYPRFDSASRISDWPAPATGIGWPVEISIMLEVISGTTEPGSEYLAMSRSISSE